MTLRSLRVLCAVVLLAACSDSPATSDDSTVTSIPPGILAAMPFQNRLDVAKGIFQMKLYNGTDEAFDVVGVQFVWDGMTTAVSDRANMLIAGDRLDYPVPLAPATCVGDGGLDEMPSFDEAYVRVLLRDGSEERAPVFDVLRFAQKLYLADCERQYIETQVRIEWVDLHAATLEDRPVTEGYLRVTRLAAEGTVTIVLVRPTIIFRFESLDPVGGHVAVLPEGTDQVDMPVRFLEGRCDAHASSEVSQPFQFSATLDLGDGVKRVYAMPIPKADQVPMRSRAEEACEILGLTGALA